MKNLRKIIALFLFIFIAGIAVTVVSINATLNKKNPVEAETVKVKDTVHLVKSLKKTKSA